MTRPSTLPALELLAWWAALAVLWLVLITAVDALELVVGAAAAAAVRRLRRVPDTMTAVAAVLLAGAPAVGVLPGIAEVVGHAVHGAEAGGGGGPGAGSGGAMAPPPH
jgi:hypothetical protein